MTPEFSVPIRVYYEDTDTGGVMYHANYLRFMDRARTEWLRALGFELDELLRQHGILFAVRSVAIDFLKPARFNDVLHVTVALGRCGAASMTVHQRLQRDDLVLCEAEVKMACINAETFLPCTLPQTVATRLTTGGVV